MKPTANMYLKDMCHKNYLTTQLETWHWHAHLNEPKWQQVSTSNCQT